MSRRQWWQKPKIRTDEEEAKHRKVTWLELFFDLVFVVVIAQLAHGFSGDVTIHGATQFILLFIPVWWVWIGLTYYNERFETEGLENRIYTFLLMIPVAGMAIFSHHGFGENYTGFALSYAVARLLITVLWVRGGIHEKVFRPTSVRYGIGFSLSITLVVLSVFVSPPVKFFMFGTALLLDLLTPVTTIRLMEKLPRFSESKLPERFGLFTIIVLGLLETTLRRHADEPIHPVISPLLKIGAGLGALLAGVLIQEISSVALLGTLLFLLSIQIVYGVYVWFSQEL